MKSGKPSLSCRLVPGQLADTGQLGGLAAGRPIAGRLIAWQKNYGRNNLPWQGTRDVYRIWLSEIMLQQTQVSTVLPYYERFLSHLPDLFSLAGADIDLVLSLWSGLGYYSRARHLHRCAREVVSDHAGCFPDNLQGLLKLPGIGPSTAAAVAVFAYGRRAAILDGNVKRVLCRHAALRGSPRAIEPVLWQIAKGSLPLENIESYTQGLMDLGAMVCTRARPLCKECPIKTDCQAQLDGIAACLPERKAPSKTPCHDVTFLVLRCGDAILLERRPDRGIWGGLFCLPEWDTARLKWPLVAKSLTVQEGLSVETCWKGKSVVPPESSEPFFIWLNEEVAFAGDLHPMLPIRHQFTHMQWNIQPILLDISRGRLLRLLRLKLSAERYRWVVPKKEASAARAAPDVPAPQCYSSARPDQVVSIDSVGVPRPVRVLLSQIWGEERSFSLPE